MTKPLMLLHNRHSPDDSDIWRVAIRRGWDTERTSEIDVVRHMEGHDFVRYYGNTLHGAIIEKYLPFRFGHIDAAHLMNLPFHTKRNVTLLPFKDIKQPLQWDAFVKPAREKYFEAKVWHKGETISGSALGNDEAYVSDIVKYLDEVRCFVLDGEVLTASLYRINTVSYQEIDEPESANFDDRLDDTPIRLYVREICAKVKLPRGVVLDFGRTADNGWSLIEFNEAWASGLYYCDPDKCFDVIVASQEDK